MHRRIVARAAPGWNVRQVQTRKAHVQISSVTEDTLLLLLEAIPFPFVLSKHHV